MANAVSKENEVSEGKNREDFSNEPESSDENADYLKVCEIKIAFCQTPRH